MTRPLRVSVIVNTLNRLSTLPTTLRGLESLRWPEVEVVVVNGPSEDGTETHLDLFWKDRIKVASCSVPNISVSRNIGIRAASGDVLAFIDDDAVPEPDWLDNLLVPYEDPAVGAVGGWVRDKTGYTFQTKYIASSRLGHSNVLLENAVESQGDWFPGLIGVNSSLRRVVAHEVGGFDERYAYFLDETDLVLRVLEAGHKVAMVESAEVHHKYAESHIRPTDNSKSTMAQVSFSKAYFAMRHGPRKGATDEDKFRAVATVEAELQNNVSWRLKARLIDDLVAARLRNEVSANVSKGIAAFYEGPRLLEGRVGQSGFKAFSRTPASDRLRLAFVSDTFFPRQVGGIAVILGELARHLAADGHEITLLTRAERGAEQSVDLEEGIWVHRLPFNAPEAGPLQDAPALPTGPLRFSNQVLAELDRINEHRKFQAVFGTIWDMDLASVIASGRYKVGMYLVTSHLLALPSKPEWKDNDHFYRNHVVPMVEAEKWALRSADRIYASTEAILSDILSAYEVDEGNIAEVARIPFGLPDHVQHTLARHDADLVITFVGRLERRKGVDLLFEALPEIMAEFAGVKVRIVGEDYTIPGTDLTSSQLFRKMHADAPWLDRVSFLGYLDDERLLSEFANCDIFVAPSRYESFGLIYLEAMRAGKPCVALRVGGVPEVVEHGVTGLLAEPDGQGLALAMSSLIRDRAKREAMGAAGRRRFESKFSISTFASQFSRDVRTWAVTD